MFSKGNRFKCIIYEKTLKQKKLLIGEKKCKHVKANIFSDFSDQQFHTQQLSFACFEASLVKSNNTRTTLAENKLQKKLWQEVRIVYAI